MKSRKVKKKIVTLIFEILIILILIGYLKERIKYNEIFYENTFINDENCSLLNVEEAREVIQNKQKQYTLEISFKDNEKQTITGTQIGLKIDNLAKELNKIKQQQKTNMFFKGERHYIDECLYNKEELRRILSSMKQLQQGYMDKKTKTEYEFNPDKKCFQIREQEIYNLNFNEVFEKVANAIENGDKEVSLEDLYLIPENNLNLNELNSLISANITYELPKGEKYVLDATTLYTWLIQDENGNYNKDEEIWNQNIEKFVIDTLQNLADTTTLSREFKPTGKDTSIIVKAGNYGYQIDTKSEIQQLKEELQENKKIVREPNYRKVEVSNENNGLGNSYIEIDLTRQKVWVYVDGNSVIETDCVTGCVNKGHETPTGIFILSYKERDRILRGKKLPNGRYEYESHVDYWMPFNGGIGLHDADWRSSFGNDIYINDGSHGCINLPVNVAKELYGIINYEMPIIVYKSN